MNQSKIAALTALSRQKIEPACEMYIAHMEACWQQSLTEALRQRKAEDLDYELKRKHQILIDAFHDVAVKIFEQTLHLENREEKSVRGASVFSSVGFDHIELAMAVSQLEAVLKIRFNQAFSLLEKRNKALFYFGKIDIQSMPFGLANITQMLKEVFLAVELNQENQLKLMHAFSQILSNSVADLYQKINQVYADAGILPNLESMQQHAKRQRVEISAKTVATGSSDLNKNFKLSDDLMLDLFKAMEDIHAYHDATGQRNYVSVDQLIQAINAVHLPKSLSLNFKGVKQLKAKVLDYIESHLDIAAPVLPKLASQSMDVLGMLAEGIVTDKDLDDRVIVALNVLVKPLMVTVIKEPEFFNDGLHPARQFLEQLLQAGSDWFGCNNLNELLVFGGLINDGYQTNPRVFEITNNDLSDWLSIEHEQALKGIQKLQAESAGKDRLRVTRQVVEQYIEQYVAANPVEFVQQFYQRVLADALSMSVLQHGKDSDSWRELKILARDVHQLTLPSEYSHKYAKKHGFDITKRSCQLMMTLNFQAADILNTESNFGSYMSWMNAAQDFSAFQSKQLLGSSAQSAIDGGQASPYVNKTLSAVEEKIYRQFLALPVGTMLDFLYEEDNDRRKILCWQNRDLDNVVLSDPTGDRSEKRSIKQVVSEMAEGVVVLVEPAKKGYFDRTMRIILKKINNHKQKKQA
ncbi:DUF1631 family protein [Marinicella rhabdoformis]|uniref:DUF1631 family protein n=1 Tax=Marinicella rhabdoformis TaxID=2580566 RepID=UPI0012AEC5D3|nr:DUF1631 family protein [Marinicella rhabdoformis]